MERWSQFVETECFVILIYHTVTVIWVSWGYTAPWTGYVVMIRGVDQLWWGHLSTMASHQPLSTNSWFKFCHEVLNWLLCLKSKSKHLLLLGCFDFTVKAFHWSIIVAKLFNLGIENRFRKVPPLHLYSTPTQAKSILSCYAVSCSTPLSSVF